MKNVQERIGVTFGGYPGGLIEHIVSWRFEGDPRHIQTFLVKYPTTIERVLTKGPLLQYTAAASLPSPLSPDQVRIHSKMWLYLSHFLVELHPQNPTVAKCRYTPSDLLFMKSGAYGGLPARVPSIHPRWAGVAADKLS